ncbi:MULTISPECIES: DUF4446 family protein [Mumia]|uniref:DUF4446 family protein n=1 Tax=Mumia TaxID=1546255 RepID=UPI001FBB14EE|nr:MULTISPECIES: DUF4446 family protein [unclassified Mumia]
MALAISILALVAAAGALLVSATAASRAPKRGRSGRTVDHLPRDTAALRREVAALADAQAQTFRHLAVVRYDAFGDTGGALSWTLALVDDSGSGVVLTSIHGRNETRTYAKSVTAWSSEQTLTPEEERALSEARHR